VNKVVLDASAVLAFLHQEDGAEYVERRLPGAAISAVNYSEVIKKAVERGGNVTAARAQLDFLQLSVIPFDSALACHAAALWPAGRESGLSFADRCCLTLAATLARPVLTADRDWMRLKLDVNIELIR
jgi:PIN domain nuclease of toxin-antitoxin system